MAVWSGSPSTFGSFHKVFLPIKNAPAPTTGTRTENTFLRYHLACRKIRPLIPVPTHRLPHNAGNASKDTQEVPFPSALGGPFAAPLFAPLSALQNSLWMRCAVLLPPQWFIYCYGYLTTAPSVCQELFSTRGGKGCHFNNCMVE